MMQAGHVVAIDSPRFREERLKDYGHAIIQIVNAEDPALCGHRFNSEVIDLSSKGIRISADKAITGAQIDCLIKIRHMKQRFFLMGEVRWAGIEATGEVQLGVEFFDDEITNLDEWRVLFE